MVIEVKNYYSILGVQIDSNETEIKKAFYQLAKKYHPDKNKEPGAEDKFKEINKAYEVLSDQSKRRLYDLQNSSVIFTPKPSTPTPTKPESQTFKSSKKEEKPTEKPKTTTSKNKTFEEEKFHQEYKKYFDSSFSKKKLILNRAKNPLPNLNQKLKTVQNGTKIGLTQRT